MKQKRSIIPGSAGYGDILVAPQPPAAAPADDGAPVEDPPGAVEVPTLPPLMVAPDPVPAPVTPQASEPPIPIPEAAPRRGPAAERLQWAALAPYPTLNYTTRIPSHQRERISALALAIGKQIGKHKVDDYRIVAAALEQLPDPDDTAAVQRFCQALVRSIEHAADAA